MSSTYSNSLRIELIGTGDQAGTWGQTTDNNFAYIFDAAIAGYQAVTVSSTSQALTYVNGPTSSASLNQSIYAILKFNSASAASSIYAPPVSKQYVIWNNTSYAITLYNSTVIGNTTAAGLGVEIGAGDKIGVWSDGTNFYDLQVKSLAETLPISSGGTGQTTANAAFNALAPTPTGTAVTAGSFVVGVGYIITNLGSTNQTQWNVIAGTSGATYAVGSSFTAATTGSSSGNGQAAPRVPNSYLKSNGTDASWDLLNLGSTSSVAVGSLTAGTAYTVRTVGTSDFTLVGATAAVTFTGTTGGVSSTTLTASSVSGTFARGMYLTGTGITAGTYISEFGTGTGNSGTYILSTAATVAASTSCKAQPVPGTVFTATGTTTGTGTATLADYVGALPVTNGGTGVGSAASLAALVGNLLYPVGALYTSTVSTNPEISLGFGNWEEFGAGQVLIGNGVTDTITVGNTISAVVTGSISTTTLTVTARSSGALAVGSYITGTSVAVGTYITSFNTSVSFTGATTGSSTTLTASSVSGTIAVGQLISGTNIAPGTVITALGTGTGGAGTYTISPASTGTVSGLINVVIGGTGSYTLNQSSTVTSRTISGQPRGNLAIGSKYTIVSAGTTDFTTFGAANNTVGTVFTATGYGTGTGTASKTWVGGDTGGDSDAIVPSHTHTGTTTIGDGVHNHYVPELSVTVSGGSSAVVGRDSSAYFSQFRALDTDGTHLGQHQHDFTTDSTGVSPANANLQPYVVVYMWKRLS